MPRQLTGPEFAFLVYAVLATGAFFGAQAAKWNDGTYFRPVRLAFFTAGLWPLLLPLAIVSDFMPKGTEARYHVELAVLRALLYAGALQPISEELVREELADYRKYWKDPSE